MSTFLKKKNKGHFYFCLSSLVLMGLLFFSSSSLAQLSSYPSGNTFAVNSPSEQSDTGDVFFSQHDQAAKETPDLKFIENSFVAGISTPDVVNTQTLGAMFGGPQTQERKEVIDYTVQLGDTVQSLADQFGISTNTILWANGLSKNSTLKIGQNLTILPVSGLIYVVKAGDTVTDIAKKYKASADDIIAFNGLADSNDISIGDPLVLKDATMPAAAPIVNVGGGSIGGILAVVPDSFFNFPLLRFKITQGLHYLNAVDISSLDGAGSLVYAAAEGVVLRAGYDRVGGNRITILHPNGVVTYYGHLSTMFVKPGDQVGVSQKIGTEGQTGQATGPHVHFQVMGAANPLAKYAVGTVVDTTKKQ